MIGKLLDIAAGELLKKFGAGNHKPGSGSAAAWDGMLSAHMLRTVIELTNEPKRSKSYGKYLRELQRIDQEIEQRVCPALEALFQQDSDKFDKVIKLRQRRDLETDSSKKRAIALEIEEALKPATEIPLDIADLCIELSGWAGYVFDYGFKSARGDSAVALNTANAAITGCLSIVELNLLSLPLDERTNNIRKRKADIKIR